MRKNLAILPWLTTDEALSALKDMTGIEMDESALDSQCEHGNCEVYAFINGEVGWSENLVFPASDEPVPDCYAIGPQKVINPAALRSPGSSTLQLLGTVCLDPNEPENKLDNVEWNLRHPLARVDLRYPAESIKGLTEKILAANNKPIDPREIRSIAKIISVMAAEAKIDLSEPYKTVEVLYQLASHHSIPLELSPTTIAKYLELAKQV